MLKSFKSGFFGLIQPSGRRFTRPLLISIAALGKVIRFSAGFGMAFIVLHKKGVSQVKMVKFTMLEAIIFHVYLNALRFHILIRLLVVGAGRLA